jgi:hypothetical protein
MTDTVEFTQDKYERFKKAYDKAVKSSKIDFEFENRKYLVTYAKYLIIYLNSHYE